MTGIHDQMTVPSAADNEPARREQMLPDLAVGVFDDAYLDFSHRGLGERVPMTQRRASAAWAAWASDQMKGESAKSSTDIFGMNSAAMNCAV